MTEREKMLAGEVYDACDPELLEDLNRVSASRQFLRDHDTEDIPEMANIKDIDIAFLPCNQPYTMTPEQVIKVTKIIRPKVLFPYYYSDTDLNAIPAQLPDIDLRIRHYE